MGGSAGTDGLRAGLPQARCRRPGRRSESQSDRYCGLRAATSNLKWADAPGNVLLAARSTSLPRDSVANVSQLVALDKTSLTERAGKLSAAKVELLLSGIDVVLGR